MGTLDKKQMDGRKVTMTLQNPKDAEIEFSLVNDVIKKKNDQVRNFWYHRVVVVACAVAVLVTLCVAGGERLSAGRLWSSSKRRALLSDDDGDVLVCYCTSRAGVAALSERLCTHAIVGFALVRDKRLHLDAELQGLLHQAAALRGSPPALKLLLSVGGGGNDAGFSAMVADHASRKIFIRSIKEVLLNYTLDGIDLDWEFPGVHDTDVGGDTRRERQHFSQLLREIRAEYVRERRPYLLTVAVAAQEVIASVAYDVEQLDLYADFVNLMSYDYHVYSVYTPFTGLNAPLLPRADEHLYLATLNVNHSVAWWLNAGLRRRKLVVGVPTYAHSFTLVNPDNAGVGAPARGYGALGNFVDYSAVCALGLTGAALRWDAESRSSLLVAGAQWLSPQLPRDAAEKARFVRRAGLRGAMIYSLDSDDLRGECAGEFGSRTALPIVKSVRNTLMADLPSLR